MQSAFLIMKMSFLGTFSAAVIVVSAIIGGPVDTNSVSNGFNIEVSNVQIDGQDITESAVNKNQISFMTKELQKKGDSSTVEYTISNNSKYDANLVMTCTKYGEKSDYYIIEEIIPETIEANSKEKGYLTVTLEKESLTDSMEYFTCLLNANAIEKR